MATKFSEDPSQLENIVSHVTSWLLLDLYIFPSDLVFDETILVLDIFNVLGAGECSIFGKEDGQLLY